ncbi:hypothetical protein KFE25_009687 [Diacronema lutheri]|uniref:Sugar phosphate transporter domain-containing protein n=3 Tax=Diacronema lutheri TaxID=2081491 RepID=A0A8J5XKY7_DIALT|nr:hypothetical protein KFE25_009687 [Diacronema lutheri]
MSDDNNTMDDGDDKPLLVGAKPPCSSARPPSGMFAGADIEGLGAASLSNGTVPPAPPAGSFGSIMPPRTLIAAVAVWYGAHAYSVVVSGALIRDLLELHPLGHLTVTGTQVFAGVVMSFAFVAVSDGCVRGGQRDGGGRCSVERTCGLSAKTRDEMGARGWLLICFAGACQLVGTAGTNASMASSGATTTQVLKATEPLFTALLQAVLLRKPSGPLALAALSLLASGTLITSASASAKGGRLALLSALLPALCACVSLPLMRVVTKARSFPRVGSGASMLLLFALVGTLPTAAVLAAAHRYVGQPPRDLRFVWSAISFNTYQLASLSVLHELDAVSHSIGNALKRVFVIAFSVVAFGERLSGQRALGLALCFVGIVLHAEQARPVRSSARHIAARMACIVGVPIMLMLAQDLVRHDCAWLQWLGLVRTGAIAAARDQPCRGS